MANREHRLGDLQLEIMKILWESGQATVNDVHHALAGGSELAPTTVATMLRKMEVRGLVRHRTEGRKFVYEPKVSEEEVSHSMADHVLERVFEGSLADMVTHLLERREVSTDELDELARLIAERKARK